MLDPTCDGVMMLEQRQVPSSSDQAFENFPEVVDELLVEVFPGSVQAEGEQELGASKVVLDKSAQPFQIRPEMKAIKNVWLFNSS